MVARPRLGFVGHSDSPKAYGIVDEQVKEVGKAVAKGATAVIVENARAKAVTAAAKAGKGVFSVAVTAVFDKLR